MIWDAELFGMLKGIFSACRPILGIFMMRFFDILISSLGLALTLPFLIILTIFGVFDTGVPVFRQTRLGKHKKPFKIIKFRTMRMDSKSVATHLSDQSLITPYGRVLRQTKLDELPQFWNVLKGDMSIVGPRPGLENQIELTDFRNKYGVFEVKPGITGLSQIRGIDMSTPELLAKTDHLMISNTSMANYFKIIIFTLINNSKFEITNHKFFQKQ